VFVLAAGALRNIWSRVIPTAGARPASKDKA
jgi:hypothetical protein